MKIFSLFCASFFLFVSLVFSENRAVQEGHFCHNALKTSRSFLGPIVLLDADGSPSQPLKQFVTVLRDTGLIEGDPQSSDEINQCFQKFLKREPGKERWHLKKDEEWGKKTLQELKKAVFDLGFLQETPPLKGEKADCLPLFGALIFRVQIRLQALLNFLQENSAEKIALMGSTRPLKSPEETWEDVEKKSSSEYCTLLKLIQNCDKEYRIKDKWKKFFSKVENRTEFNMVRALWECLVPKEVLSRYDQDHLIFVNAGDPGINDNPRASISDTAALLVEKLPKNDKQHFVVILELPHAPRLDHVLRKKVFETIGPCSFSCQYLPATDSASLSVILDEIARSLYQEISFNPSCET